MDSEPLGLVRRYVRQLADAEGLAALPDGPLLERFASGDETAFAILMERYASQVLGVCRRLLAAKEDVEDAFQATFLVLARRAKTLDRRGPIGNWLRTVAHHIAVRARADTHRRQTHEKKAAVVPETQEDAGREEVRGVLDEELRQLPDKYRLPLTLCYLQGKTHAQAAAELGWPAGSMSRRLTRARELLRRRLVRRGLVLAWGLPGLAASSARAATWAAATLRGMSMTNVRTVSAMLLALLVLGGGLALGLLTAGPPEKRAAAPAATDRTPERMKDPTKKDAGRPAVPVRARLPEIKVVKILDKTSVVFKTDRQLLDRMHGEGLVDDRHFIDGATGQVKEDPQARPPNELTFKAGEACMLGGGNVQKWLLLRIENGKAVLRYTAHLRSGGKVDEVIAVAPYEDARWDVDGRDSNRVTYTEFDEKGRKKIVKHYKSGRLHGTWTTWYPNGRKETEYHFADDQCHGPWTEWYPNGQKRHEATYRKGRLHGKETFWSAEGNTIGTGEHE